jgi:acetolactate synthase I/II/III large subunit
VTISTETAPSVAVSIARYLASRGIRRVYGLPGEDHMGLLAALGAEGLDYVGAREETAACMMACADIQQSGLPAVALVTLAPGLTNAINGIANAYLDQLPLIVLCGQHPIERGSSIIRQQLDNRTVVQGVTKAFFAATRSINHDLSRAFATACESPPGPVLVEVRDEIAQSQAADDLQGWTAPAIEAAASWAVPAQIAAELASASHPAILIGPGLGGDGLDALASSISRTLRAPVFVTPSAGGRVAPDNPWFGGTFLNGNMEASILSHCDAILTVDLRANEIFNRPWPYVPIVSIAAHRDTEQFFPRSHEVVGSTPALLSSLAKRLDGSRVVSSWTVDDVATHRCQVESNFVGPESALTIPAAIKLIRERMPSDTRIAVDAGFGKPLLAYLWTTNSWPAYFSSSGLSTMGYAIPATNALQLTSPPGRRVVGFMGDGSLLMRASEITVAVELKLPCIYVAWMDAALTQIGIKQRRAGLPQVGTTIPDYSCRKIAEAFGAVGYDATSIAELASALEKVLAQSSPALIGAHVDQSRSAEWFELLRG